MDSEDLVICAAVLADVGLRPSAKLVLARLAGLVRGAGLVFVSQRALSAFLGLSEKEVEGALRELEAGGRIVVEVSHAGRARPKGYRVLRPAAPGLAALRAVPAEDPPAVAPANPVQLTLFDDSTHLPSDGARSKDHPGTSR